jgi:gliding motility-associated-like protein/uncharacterized repeat protein (TIGR01451 family)
MKYIYAILLLPQLLFSQVPININSGNPAFPFPQFSAYEYTQGHKLENLANKNADGLTHAEMEKRIREAWLIMSNAFAYDADSHAGVKYIKSNIGCPYDCSEGAGYAMIAAAYMGDKTTFDGIWFREHDIRLVKHPRYRDGIVPRPGYLYGDNSLAEPGGDSATDGDVDIALGLLMAWKQWGNNSGYLNSSGQAISYKQEALSVIRGLVESKNSGFGDCRSVTGVVGIDGYLKNGNTWTEITDWASSQNPCPEFKGPQQLHVDYVAPAYFKEFAEFLKVEGDANDLTWNVPQFLRAEASSDWFMGELFKQGSNTVPIAGWVSLDASNKATFSNFNEGEDFRYAWRTILNNTWHGDPTVTWNPTSHQAIAGGNVFNKDMGKRFSKFLSNPSIAGNTCIAPGGGLPMTFQGPSQVVWSYNPNTGLSNGGFPLNWVSGTGSPSAVTAQDFDLMGKLFRQCAIEWEQESGLNLDSKPRYFHGFFRLLGMLVLTGNFEAPMAVKPEANLKIYNKVDKTVAFTGDQVTFTYSYRNYGSVAAQNTKITDIIPTGLEFVSATGGGINTAGTVTWTIGNVAGFTSAGGILPTSGEVKVTCKVSKGFSGRLCNPASITTTTGKGWTSNEFPNEVTAVMQRNCVDIIEKALEIKKTVDYTIVNPNDIVTYTVDFKNSSVGGYINGGRSGINFAYARGSNPANGDTQGIKVRLYHGAAEPYINYENYRVSLFLNDNTYSCIAGTTGCPNGWAFRNTIYEGGNVNGIKVSQENIVPGSDARGAWNQRVIVQFADQLCGPTPHLLRYYGLPRIHEGGGQPLRAVWDLYTSNYGSVNWSDDWSWDANASDLNGGFYYPITNDWTDHYNPNKPVNIYHNEACEKPTKTVDNVLVEEWDGYVWRRVFGSGPVPGRDVENVVVTDILPKGFTFIDFVGSNPLGIAPTTSTLPDGRTEIKWEIPRLQIGQNGILKYRARANFSSGVCQRADEIQKNTASIKADNESPIPASVDVTVTCNPVILPPAPSSMTKIATPTSINVGDQIVYTLSYKNTDGSPIEVNFTNPADWTAQSGTKMTVATNSLTSISNNSGVTTYNYSHGTNGTLEAKIDFTPNAAFGFAMRHTGGAIANGLYIVFKPNPGAGTVDTRVYDGTTEIKRTVLGSPANPMDIKIALSGNQMNVWLGNTTNPTPTWSVVDIPIRAGNCGFINGFTDGSDTYGTHKVTRFKTSMDSAFNMQITDPIPSEVDFVSASDSGINATGIVTYPLIPGPILANQTISYTWTALSKSCPSATSKITNRAYTNIFGLANNSIAAQAVVDCLGINPCGILPSKPIVTTPVMYCQNDTAVPLTATAIAGATLVWYATATSTTSIPTPTPNTAMVGDTSYFVSQTVGTCESAREEVKISILAPPPPPVVTTTSVLYCQNDTAVPLTATALPNATLTWYTDATTTTSIPTPTPDTAVLSFISYFVSQTVGTCESARAEIKVNIAEPPDAPIVFSPPVVYCQNDPPQDLIPSVLLFNTLIWYADATSTASIPTPTLDTSVIGEFSYYLSVKIGTCESPRSEVKVTVLPPPLAPVVTTPVVYCQNDTATQLTATALPGATLTWYTDATTTTSIPTPTPDTTVLSDVSYFVSQSGGTCESARSEVKVTVSTAPLAPLISPVVYCQNDTATQLTATALPGATLTWYTDATTTTSIPTPTPDTTVLGDVSYFVSQTVGTCESPRAEVKVNISAPPLVPVVTSPVMYCQNETTVPLTATPLPNATLTWYTDATITTSIPTPTPDTAMVGDISYFVSQTVGTCESPRAEVKVTISTAPLAPVVTSPVIYCQNDTATQLTATALLGATLTWYADATTTTSIPTPTLDTAVLGDISYFVSQTMGTCESARSEIKVSITAPPAPPIVASTPVIYCQNDTTLPLAATALPGATLVWYATATSTTSIATPSVDTSVIGDISYFVSQTMGTCESAKSEIKVSITTPPASPIVSTTPVVYCQNDTALPLVATSLPGATLVWYATATSTTSIPMPSVATSVVGDISYFVSQTMGTCESARSEIKVSITAPPAPPIVATPAVYCQNDTALPLVANALPGATLIWYATATSTTSIPMPSVATSVVGDISYFVSQTMGTCESARSEIKVIVKDAIKPNFENDLSFCSLSAIPDLDTTSPNGIKGTWNPAVIDNQVSASYLFTPDDNQCASEQIINVTITDPKQISVDCIVGDAFSGDTTIVVQATPAGNYEYQLDGGTPQTSNVFENIKPGTYTVTVTDPNGCSVPVTKDVLVIDYPKYFTPNGDGVHDNWNILGLSEQPDSKIYIFDRLGKFIKQISPTGEGWNGTYNGEPLPSTDYWFTVDYKEKESKKQFKAHFALKR